MPKRGDWNDAAKIMVTYVDIFNGVSLHEYINLEILASRMQLGQRKLLT